MGRLVGHRNFDRLPFARQAEGIYTIADMIRARWKVTSRCETCGNHFKVSLPTVAKVLGPTAELWGRHPRCLLLTCHGRQTYQAWLGVTGGPLTGENRLPPVPKVDPSPRWP
jgi:hypothetical protein